ncbi:MAG: ABC transporter permease [Myxococcaceae bacterium]
MRYLRLLAVQLRASALLAIQYRGDFLVDGPISLLWAGTSLAPLFVAYKNPATVVEGWSFGEALLVTGWFLLLTGVLEGAINPSLVSVVDHIRKGTLDFVLLKPADAQFLVSTSRFEPWRMTHVFTSILIFVYGFVTLHRMPSVPGIASALLLLLSSTLLLYSLWILTVSAAFYVVKVDNLTYLFNSLFDLARWPSSFFQGVLRFIFTAVVPLALMTTFPAEAMLNRLHASSLLFAIGGSLLFALLARLVWTRSIGHYTSASS